MKARREKDINAINKILLKRKSDLPLLTSESDTSSDIMDNYNDVLSDELMELGIDAEGNINEYGVYIDRLIELICIMKEDKHRLTRAHREKQLKMSCQALHNAPPNRT